MFLLEFLEFIYRDKKVLRRGSCCVAVYTLVNEVSHPSMDGAQNHGPTALVIFAMRVRVQPSQWELLHPARMDYASKPYAGRHYQFRSFC